MSTTLGSILRGVGGKGGGKGDGIPGDGAMDGGGSRGVLMPATKWELWDALADEFVRWGERLQGFKKSRKSDDLGSMVPPPRVYAGAWWALQTPEEVRQCWEAMYRNLGSEKRVFGASVEGAERCARLLERMKASPRVLVPVFWPLQARAQWESAHGMWASTWQRVPEGRRATLYANAYAGALLESSLARLSDYMTILNDDGKVKAATDELGELYVNQIMRLGYLLSSAEVGATMTNEERDKALNARTRVWVREGSTGRGGPIPSLDADAEASKAVEDEKAVMDQLRRSLVEHKVATALSADLASDLSRACKRLGVEHCGYDSFESLREEVSLVIQHAVEAFPGTADRVAWLDATAERARRALPANEANDSDRERIRRIVGEWRRSAATDAAPVPSLMLFGEFHGNVAMFTGLREMETLGADKAPSYMHWAMMDELLKPGPPFARGSTPEEVLANDMVPGVFNRVSSSPPKGVALVHGDVLQPDLMDVQDAREVFGLAMALYDDDELYTKFVETFNREPEKFDYEAFMDACANLSASPDDAGRLGDMPVSCDAHFHLLKRLRAYVGSMSPWPETWPNTIAPGYFEDRWPKAWLTRFLVLDDAERRERLGGPLTGYAGGLPAHSLDGLDEDVDASEIRSIQHLVETTIDAPPVVTREWQRVQAAWVANARTAKLVQEYE